MTRKKWRYAGLGAAATAIALTTSVVGTAAQGENARGLTGPEVVVAGLDNPRQLSRTADGELVVALAGRGDRTGKLGIVDGGEIEYLIRGMKSFAEPDGTFAVGVNGGGKQAGGPYYAIGIPRETPSGRANDVWLLSKKPGGDLHKVANISAFERANDPDGEGVDSNPYSLLALDKKVLVADAAGDYIASVTRGNIRVWAVMPEYGKKIDAVPTVLS